MIVGQIKPPDHASSELGATKESEKTNTPCAFLAVCTE
jgi:hypothetical protein